MSYTDATELRFLNHLLSDPADTPTATLYLGLSSTTPTDAGGNITEPSAGAYARQAVAAAVWDAAAAGSKDNGSVVTYPTATADWLSGADLTYAVYMDALTNGNCEAYGLLDTAKPVTNGDTASFAAAALVFTLN